MAKSKVVKLTEQSKTGLTPVHRDLHSAPEASQPVAQSDQKLFDNLSELLTPEMVAEALHTTRATVYQWHSRPRKYRVPESLFLKLGRKLLIRRDVLRTWVLARLTEEDPNEI